MIALLRRYGPAALGPASVSASQLLMQVGVLRVADAASFGRFAFLLGFVQFGYGISNALVSTPYTVAVNEAVADPDRAVDLAKANGLFAVVFGVCCGAAAYAMGGAQETVAFALFGCLAMLRWFGRSHLYATHRPDRVAASDAAYAVTLLVCTGLLWSAGLFSIDGAVWLLSAATAFGLAFIGADFIVSQARALVRGSLKTYGEVWRTQARWILLGVASSEATANAHAYAVVAFVGPAAFAPIATAMLFVKPVSLALASLTQLERPAMARSLAGGDMAAALETTRLFRIVAMAAWVVATAAGVAVLVFRPTLLLKSHDDVALVAIAFAQWSAISLLQCWSSAPGVLLQAAKEFRGLAKAGAVCGVIAVVAVLGLIVSTQPVYTLLGVMLGQFATSVAIAGLAARLQQPAPRSRRAFQRRSVQERPA